MTAKIPKASSADKDYHESVQLNITNGDTSHVTTPSPAASSCSSREQSSKLKTQNSVNLDVPFLEQFNPGQYDDSGEAAKELFKLLISPVGIKRFYE